MNKEQTALNSTNISLQYLPCAGYVLSEGKGETESYNEWMYKTGEAKIK